MKHYLVIHNRLKRQTLVSAGYSTVAGRKACLFLKNIGIDPDGVPFEAIEVYGMIYDPNKSNMGKDSYVISYNPYYPNTKEEEPIKVFITADSLEKAIETFKKSYSEKIVNISMLDFDLKIISN